MLVYKGYTLPFPKYLKLDSEAIDQLETLEAANTYLIQIRQDQSLLLLQPRQN